MKHYKLERGSKSRADWEKATMEGKVRIGGGGEEEETCL